MTFHIPSPFGIYARSNYVYTIILYKCFCTPCEIITECLGTPNALDKIDETIKTQSNSASSSDSALSKRITAVEQKNTQQDTAIVGKVDVAQGIENVGKVLTVGDDGNITLMAIASEKWTQMNTTIPSSVISIESTSNADIKKITILKNIRIRYTFGDTRFAGLVGQVIIPKGFVGVGSMSAWNSDFIQIGLTGANAWNAYSNISGTMLISLRIKSDGSYSLNGTYGGFSDNSNLFRNPNFTKVSNIESATIIEDKCYYDIFYDLNS